MDTSLSETVRRENTLILLFYIISLALTQRCTFTQPHMYFCSSQKKRFVNLNEWSVFSSRIHSHTLRGSSLLIEERLQRQSDESQDLNTQSEFLVCMCYFCLSVFRLQTRIWGRAVKSTIGSSTTRSCLASMPPEWSERQRLWTERSAEENNVFRCHMTVIVVECITEKIERKCWLFSEAVVLMFHCDSPSSSRWKVTTFWS